MTSPNFTDRDYKDAMGLYYRAHFGESGMVEEIANALARARESVELVTLRSFALSRRAEFAEWLIEQAEGDDTTWRLTSDEDRCTFRDLADAALRVATRRKGSEAGRDA